MYYIKTIYLVIIAICYFTNIYAGVTGKIAGRVIDSSTKQPLPGVNITIEDELIGAATDVDGYYLILQVKPGTYLVRFSMIGYKDMLLKDVRVSADYTTPINVEMIEELIELGETIVVTAERPVIQKDVTSSTQFVDSEELLQLPVATAKEGLMLQTGVFFDPIPVGGGFQNSAGRGESRYSVRGGSEDEVQWYVDGVRTASKIAGRADWGGSFTNVNLNAIEEAQVITGGFNAEYGEAQSGIVNIITKEGGQKFTTSLDYLYSPPGKRHFGNYLYDQPTQREFIDHMLADGTLDPDWWTPYRASQIYDYREFPDHQLNMTLGGNLFQIRSNPLNFFLAGQYREEAYALPHPRNARTTENIMLNLSNRISTRIKLRLQGMYNHEGHSTLQEIGDFTNQAKFYRGWGSIIDIYTSSASLHLSHTISPKLFYELKFSFFEVEYKEGPSKYTNIGSSAIEDQTIWGYHRYEGLIDEPFDKYAPILKGNTVSGDVSFTGNMSWQFDKSNLAKAGFEFRYNTVGEKESVRFPTFTDINDLWLNRGLHETYHPIQFAMFLQDKMEFESMILNIGLRYDYLNPNYDWFDNQGLYNLAIDPAFDPLLDPDGDQIDENGHVKYSFQNVLDKPRSPAKSYHMVSPRFGVSFPMSEKTLLHFNYGHFYQMPAFDYMFELFYFRPVHIVDKIVAEREAAQAEGREPNHIPSPDGDPERIISLTVEPLKPQQTVMFEVGFKYDISDLAVLGVTAYYKDVFEQTEERIGLFDRSVKGYDPFNDRINPTAQFGAYFPGDYGDSKGFEISFRTLLSHWYTFDLNYTFSKSLQGRASPAVVTLQQDGSANYQWDDVVNKRIPIEKSFSRPHILRANLYFRYEEDWTNSFFDVLFNDFIASILYRYISGRAFTYLGPEDPPDTYDNYRYPSYQTVDLRLEKGLNIAENQRLFFYLRVTNLFNRKNLRSLGENFYLQPNQVLSDYVEEGEIKSIGEFGYDIGWQTYHAPRRFYFGFKYFFN